MSLTIETLNERENLLTQKIQEQTKFFGDLQVQGNAINQKMQQADMTLVSLKGHLEEIQFLKSQAKSETVKNESEAAN